MEAVVYTESLQLYALVHGALGPAGWKVYWKEGRGLALAGLADLWMAVLADMGSSLLVIFNGLRALKSTRRR